MTMRWGILGPGSIESVRRVRTLDLTPCVRLFNELAVPGLGGPRVRLWAAVRRRLCVVCVYAPQERLPLCCLGP